MTISAPPAQSEQESPYLPAGMTPLVLEQFAGLNTQAPRSGIADQELWWCDGWFPIVPGCLRTMWGPSGSIYTASSGTTIVAFYCGNIGGNNYAIVFQSDGSVVAVNLGSFATTAIATTGTITNLTRGQFGIGQWGPLYILIVANQTNGYWVWDGTTLYSSGGVGRTLADTVSSGTVLTMSAVTGIADGLVVTAEGIPTNTTVTGISGDSVTISEGVTGTINAGTTITFSNAGPGGIAMPFGIQGTALETYGARVWVANGATITFSAPGSYTDFSTGNGGGSFTSTDSFLRAEFVQPRQTNGFLYLIADSSVNYVSGVSTSGTPPTTTFTNQNADPELGTPFADAIDVFSRNIIFANTFGAHVSYGGAVTKVSDQLDGFYTSDTEQLVGQPPSSAKAIVFGKKIWCVLLPIINPVTGVTQKKLVCWYTPNSQRDAPRWFTTDQGVNLTFINGAEIASDLIAYGTDGTHIYQLFTDPSTAFEKTVVTKLWDKPGGAVMGKVTNRFWGVLYYDNVSSSNLTVQVDSENGSYETPLTVSPSADSFVVLPPQAIANQGVLTGLTVTTSCADMTICSLAVGVQPFEYRG